MPSLRRTTGLALTGLVAASLTACSDDGRDEPRGDREDTRPGAWRGLDWSLPAEEADISFCGDAVVNGTLGEVPEVARADGTITTLEITMPAEATLQPTEDWNYRARCQDTLDGDPVVVVEWTERSLDVEEFPPTVYAGFDLAGEQLWTREGPVDGEVVHGGLGVLAFGVRDGTRWTFVDSTTGEEIDAGAFGDGSTTSQPNPITPTLLKSGDELLSLSGRVVATLPASGPVETIDAERLLVETPDGIGVYDLTERELVWSADDDELIGIPLEATMVDVSTGSVLAQDRDNLIHAYDLETGEEKWVSEVEASLFGVGSIGSGVAVLPAEDYRSQQLLDTATGEVLSAAEDHYVIAGDGLLVDVDDYGKPARITVDDLR